MRSTTESFTPASSVVPARNVTAWISAQRPPRTTTLDPFKPHAFFAEEERGTSGDILNSATILLTNRECPWRCLMCDLWKKTLTQTVPAGAIPAQIEFALSRLPAQPDQIKLYNSGSFFDPLAIPPEDYPVIARAASGTRHVVVECHPRLVGPRVLSFQSMLNNSLEVAMGLETIHPGVLLRLNKKFTLVHFTQAADFLRQHNIGLRAFVLVQPPFLNEEEGLEWTVNSAQFAFESGASAVSLIPTRHGNGAMDRLLASGEFVLPRLSILEKAFEMALGLPNAQRVFADTWDLNQFSHCPACLEPRRQRLHAMNLSQKVLPRMFCSSCDGS